MVNEGVRISYCPEIVAYYSYGGGVSTSNDSKWKRLIVRPDKGNVDCRWKPDPERLEPSAGNNLV